MTRVHQTGNQSDWLANVLVGGFAAISVLLVIMLSILCALKRMKSSARRALVSVSVGAPSRSEGLHSSANSGSRSK